MITLKHTIWFIIVANILLWGGRWYLHSIHVNKQVTHQVEMQKIKKAPPIDMNKSVPTNLKEYLKSLPKQEQAEQGPPVKMVQPEITAPAPVSEESWFSKNWPFITTALTTIPTIVVKWKDMFDKCFHKHKRHHTRNDR